MLTDTATASQVLDSEIMHCQCSTAWGRAPEFGNTYFSVFNPEFRFFLLPELREASELHSRE